MKNLVRIAFDKLSAYYANEVDKTSPFNVDYERPATVSMLPSMIKEKTILDAGCAAGWYTEYLLNKGAHVTAIDLCPDMVEVTNRRCNNRANVFCHDLSEPLPFVDESFDIILSSLALHFLEEWVPTLKEFHRILKKNGLLIFSVCHPFADLSPYQSKSYFETELVHEVWDKGEKVDIYFYRRPMQKIYSDTSLYFTIKEILEPQPEDSFQLKNPVMYQYLMTHPHFLIIEAEKRGIT